MSDPLDDLGRQIAELRERAEKAERERGRARERLDYMCRAHRRVNCGHCNANALQLYEQLAAAQAVAMTDEKVRRATAAILEFFYGWCDFEAAPRAELAEQVARRIREERDRT